MNSFENTQRWYVDIVLQVGKNIDMVRQARNTQYGMQEAVVIQTYLVYGTWPT
jgi:hypothetical protein